MKIIGLTGGIASGKSTVSNMLKELGAVIIDADKIAREIVNPGHKVLNDITEAFGNEILNKDGTLNRKLLGGIVFNNPVKLDLLNTIMHPEIKNHILSLIETYRENCNTKIIVLDAAILLESGMDELVDEVWLVYVDYNTQLSRLTRRDNLTHSQAVARIRSQMSVEEKIKLSDRVIDNMKDIENTKLQVEMLWSDNMD